MRKLTLLCRIVDNLGDAGVALRLARYWLHRHPTDLISICTDQKSPFQRLLGLHRSPIAASTGDGANTLAITADHTPDNTNLSRLTLVETLDPNDGFEWGEIIIEMFGTPLPTHWKQRLAACNPQPAWVNLEYLSAEPWVEDCHGLWSTDPDTGWQQLFFFPGFTEKTGGLMGEEPQDTLTHRPAHETGIAPLTATATTATDSDDLIQPQAPGASAPASPRLTSSEIRAFVFAYTLDPLLPWLSVIDKNADAPPPLSFHIASASHHASICETYPDQLHRIDFVRQTDFDGLLKSFDLLFVRGEDSFVRAQLSGLPFVWQIYPTADGAHWTKLDAFFSIYAQGLAEPIRERLKALWWYWNGENSDADSPTHILHALLSDMDELHSHAKRWKEALSSQCHLIDRLEQAIAAKTRDKAG